MWEEVHESTRSTNPGKFRNRRFRLQGSSAGSDRAGAGVVVADDLLRYPTQRTVGAPPATRQGTTPAPSSRQQRRQQVGCVKDLGQVLEVDHAAAGAAVR